MTTTEPTIVLVHGAFADASSWNGVIELLQQQGYVVVAPAVPLHGLAADRGTGGHAASGGRRRLHRPVRTAGLDVAAVLGGGRDGSHN